MNARRAKLADHIALQTAAARQHRDHPIQDFQAWTLREPVSGRRYTVVRLRTRSGVTGWGEGGPATARDAAAAKDAIAGRPATAYATFPALGTLSGAVNMAALDISAKICSTPVYRLLSGPTRVKARALATLQGTNDQELAADLARGIQAGFRAFQAPLPPVTARNLGLAFDKAVRQRMEALRAASPPGIDFVLSGSGSLSAGDAASVARSLERFHLLWFDEPCPARNMRTWRKIAEEQVTPLGFGRDIDEPSLYQDLLREGVVDVLRPSVHVHGLYGIRKIATLAETYYTAIAPNHDGGPVATAAALHLAASLPNFFIQHIPRPSAETDRKMRTELVPQAVETVRDGFAALPEGPGLGIDVNENVLERYKEAV